MGLRLGEGIVEGLEQGGGFGEELMSLLGD